MAEIQARHDRAFIRELADYLRQNPKADDRDQAYAALFNKAIEHDWFSEAEEQGRQYLKSDPNGPVKALAQIILTMGRAQAGRFDEALERFRELMQGLGQNEQEEFAASFSENLATEAITAGEFGVAREVYTTLLSRFSDSPNLRQKVAARAEAAGQGRQARPVVHDRRHQRQDRPPRCVSRQVRPGRFLGDLVCALHCRAAPAAGRLSAPITTPASRSSAISLDESKTAVVDFAKARNIPWPQLHNASGSTDLVEGFGVSSIPATYLIDPEGTVIRLDLRGKALDETLRRLIKSPVKTTAPAVMIGRSLFAPVQCLAVY